MTPLINYIFRTGPDRRLWCISSHLLGGGQSLVYPCRIFPQSASGHGFDAFALLYFGGKQNRLGEIASNLESRWTTRFSLHPHLHLNLQFRYLDDAINWNVFRFFASRWKVFSVHLPLQVRGGICGNQSQCWRTAGWHTYADTSEGGALRAAGNCLIFQWINTRKNLRENGEEFRKNFCGETKGGWGKMVKAPRGVRRVFYRSKVAFRHEA